MTMDEAVASGDAIVIPVGGNRVVTYDFDTVEKCMGGADASVDQMKDLLAKVDRFGDMLRNRILDDSQSELDARYKAQSETAVKWLTHKLLSTSNATYLVRKVWFEMSSGMLYMDCVVAEFDHGTHVCRVQKVTITSKFVYDDICEGMKTNVLNFGGRGYSVEKPNSGHVAIFDKVATWANSVARELETISLVKDKTNATGKCGQKCSGKVRKGGGRSGGRKPVVRTGDADV